MPHKRRQCLELIELSATHNLSGGKLRIFLPAPVVDVRCVVAEDQRVLLVVATVSGFRAVWLEVPAMDDRGTIQAGLASIDRQALRTETEVGQGLQVLCADARASAGGEVDVFLGTDGGVTVSMSVSKRGRATPKAEFRQVLARPPDTQCERNRDPSRTTIPAGGLSL